MSRLSSPRGSSSAAVPALASTAPISPSASTLSPRHAQPASPPPAAPTSEQPLSALDRDRDRTALSAAVSITPADPPPPLPAAEPRLPSLRFPFYSSTALCAPFAQAEAQSAPPPVSPSRRPARPFFLRCSAAGARPRAAAVSVSESDATDAAAGPVATQSSASSAAPSSQAAVRSYRRRLPDASIAESLRILTWPHARTAHSAQQRAAYLSLLPPAERERVQCAVAAELAQAAGALLAVLDGLEPLCSRPYERALHRMRPSQWLPPSRPRLLRSALAPFASSLALLSDGQDWLVGQRGVDAVRERVAQARAELLALRADAGSDEAAGERTDTFAAQTELRHEEAAQQAQGAVGRHRDESKSEEGDEDDERVAAEPARLSRHKSMHPAPMHVRPMPAMPTAVRHSRSTFKASNGRSQPAPRSQPPAQPRGGAADVAHSSRTEAGAHQKPLSNNVAGDRRTLPIALPRAFLSAAPTIDAAARGPAPFTVQPAVLDLGPLLAGCSYTATLLLTNTSSRYARFAVSLPPPACPSAASSGPPLSVSFAFRRGGLAAGLSKALTAVVACTATGQYEAEVLVTGGGGSVRVALCADCMDDAERWREERRQRDGLSAGELGLTVDSSLPGSLKSIEAGSEYGRVKQMGNVGSEEEESKEQILLSRWQNKPAHN